MFGNPAQAIGHGRIPKAVKAEASQIVRQRYSLLRLFATKTATAPCPCALTLGLTEIMKTIKYYRTNQWGVEREFVHPDSAGDAQIIQRLTGKKTIDGTTRELFRDLFGGHGPAGLEWKEVVAP